METTERLYRSKTNKVIGGVAGGLADYFNIDVVLARVIFVLLALFGGGGVLIYIVMWIVIPEHGPDFNNMQTHDYNKNETTDKSGSDSKGKTIDWELADAKKTRQSNTGLIAGIVLIFLGMLFLADRLMPWYNVADFWPLLLVLVGVLIIKPDIFKPIKKQSDEI